MGGRPSVVGCFAVAVALLLVAPIVVPPAAAQIRIPLPGEDAKPKAEHKKRAFRPTIPRRNPSRVTASIVADATSSSSATTEIEAASAAGAASSATVAVTLPPKPSAPVETAALLQDTDAPNTLTSEEKTQAVTAEDPASTAEPSAETAEASPAEEASEKETVQASEPQEIEAAREPEESAPSATNETVETTEEQAVADQSDAAADTSPEPAAPAAADAPVETAAAPSEESSPPESESPASDAAESAEAAPAESADAPPEETPTAEVAPVDSEAAEAEDAAQIDEPEETATVPSHDATVVLEVSPPPDEVIVAAVTTPEAETPASDEPPTEEAEVAPTDSAAPEEAEAQASDEPAAELAAVAPSEIAPPAPAPAEQAETSGTEDTDSEDAADSDDDADNEDAAGAEQPAASPDDSPPSEEAVSEEAVSEDAVNEDAVSEEAAVPEPVPAHPIVAAVRASLAGPQEGVAGSDLEALKAFYGAREEPPLWITEEGFTPKAQALIEEIGKADEWGLNPAAFEVPPPNDLLATPNAHADDELQLSIAVLKYARQAQAGRLTPGQASSLFDQNPPLRDPAEVLKEIAASDDPSAYLVSLHPQHDQFKRLRTALQNARGRAEANGSNPDNDPNIQRILINMERWRWMPRSLGAFYVWNNIPEFEARVVKNGKIIYDEKTVVGQVKYATPFFSAPMRNIVFHPDWTVPPTIVKEDIAPKLQSGGGGGFFGGGSSQFLRRHGLKVSLAGEPVDADRVDWRNQNVHRYTFTQDPGPANVLGKLKFNFPNRHAIYMHDTVQPEFFAERLRTLSHGCIRVQSPDRFATLLLAEDKGWSAGRVQSLLANNETVTVPLNRLVPVHLTYFTVTVDEGGSLNLFDDIYGIDNRMAAKLFKNPAKFHVPPVPAIVEASSRPRNQGRPQAGGLDNIISGLFGN